MQPSSVSPAVLPLANVAKLETAAALGNMQFMGVRTVEEAMERLF
jgi:hypothetical protein